jgi:hypothetical protein
VNRPSNAGSFRDDQYAVDGTGRVVHPGDQVRIRMNHLYESASHGKIISFRRRTGEALVNIGTDEPAFYPLSRLALDSGVEEPAWVFGSY